MGFEIEQAFTIDAPIDEVWSFLTDPNRVAACLPGAAITGQQDEHTYTGTMSVKVGPVMSSYKGKMRFVRLDEDARIAEISASGQDVRGKGGAEMRMTSQLIRVGERTEVTVKSDVSVMGLLAQLGRGMIQDVSDQLFQQFTAAMRAELEPGGDSKSVEDVPPPPAGPEVLDVGSLGLQAGRNAMGRLVRKPTVWVAVAVFALAVYLVLLR